MLFKLQSIPLFVVHDAMLRQLNRKQKKKKHTHKGHNLTHIHERYYSWSANANSIKYKRCYYHGDWK